MSMSWMVVFSSYSVPIVMLAALLLWDRIRQGAESPVGQARLIRHRARPVHRRLFAHR